MQGTVHIGVTMRLPGLGCSSKVDHGPACHHGLWVLRASLCILPDVINPRGAEVDTSQKADRGIRGAYRASNGRMDKKRVGFCL